jgi:excisionase family DNA binding protein
MRTEVKLTVGSGQQGQLPLLLTVAEVANLLRTTVAAVYVMAARDQLPGVTRLGRRLLVRSDTLLHWLNQKSAPSFEERR